MPAQLSDNSLLTIDTVVRYLVDRGVMNEADIADGRTVVDAVPRRNNNLRVRSEDGSGYFVKQASELSASRRSVSREGRFYSELQSERSSLTARLAEFVLFDPVACVLVLRLLPNHQTVRDYCAGLDRAYFPIHVWRALGRLMAAVHDYPASGRSMASPIVHMIDPSPEVLATISPGGLKVFEIAQTATIRRGLEQVADMWRQDTFLHGDLRSDNIMIANTVGADDLRLVDWELCGLADPMWDIAACFDLGITLSFGRYVAGELSVPIVQATARQVWHAYRSTRGAQALSSSATPTNLAMFTASRLVQSALEFSEQAGDLSKTAVCSLQIADNIFADPSRAASELFALST
jgi:Phosphotransferase enzyme family